MARASPTSAAMCRSWPQACMTGTSFPFGSIPVARLAYGETGRLLDRERVHVGPDEERRPGPVLEHGRDAVPADPPVDRAAGRLERVREPLRRAGLLPESLGVRVERAVEVEEGVVDRAGNGPGERRRHGEYMAGAEDKPRG